MQWLLWLAVLAFAAALIALVVSRQQRRRQRLLAVRLRSSAMYSHLYPLLVRCRKRPLEAVTIRPEAVTLRFVLPVGRVIRYAFEQQGFDPPSPEQLAALAQAIAMDLPMLNEADRYRFHTHSETKANGTRVQWYEYTITSERKDELLRAARNRAEAQRYV